MMQTLMMTMMTMQRMEKSDCRAISLVILGLMLARHDY